MWEDHALGVSASAAGEGDEGEVLKGRLVHLLPTTTTQLRATAGQQLMRPQTDSSGQHIHMLRNTTLAQNVNWIIS